MFTSYVLIAAGGAIGSMLRYWAAAAVATLAGEHFPWGTIIVNIVGSFAIGLFSTLTGPDGRAIVPVYARQFFMIGVCGGFTTFSSFSLQTLLLAQDGKWLWAGANVLISVTLCLLGVWLGHMAAVLVNE
jgi:CrcB protein